MVQKGRPIRRRIALDSMTGRFSSVRAIPILTPDRTFAARDVETLQPRPPETGSDLRFALLRAPDLLAFEVLARALRLEDRDGLPHLVPDGTGPARLTIDFTFQHLGEAAFYLVSGNSLPDPLGSPNPVPAETEDLGSEATPVDARAAHGSRIVFAVPEHEAILFSTEGILAAMARLEMVVVPVAVPRRLLRFPRLIEEAATIAGLPGGLALAEIDGTVVLGSAREAAGQRLATLNDVIAAGRALQQTRARLATAAALDIRETQEGAALPSLFERRGVTLVPPVIGPLPARGPRPRRPREDETAIEAPFRLFLSPSTLNGWVHALSPVPAPDDANRVELWHTRLGVRVVDQVTGTATIDERAHPQKIVRAIWARELELPTPPTAHSNDAPFRQSLDGLDRTILVRQSAETLSNPTVRPEPVTVRTLALSSLGTWLDLFGHWDHTLYDRNGSPAIESWDHIAPMGRDQYVRVAYPGFLYPFGHKAVLIKVSERKIRAATDPQARLYQRKFIIVSEPIRRYTNIDSPFGEVRLDPLSTPDLVDPIGGPDSIDGQDLFWPNVPGGPFLWKLHALDREGQAVQLNAPLLFVASHLTKGPPATWPDLKVHYETGKRGSFQYARIPALGQRVAYAPPLKPGDTASETVSIMFTGQPTGESSTPSLSTASVVLPAMRHLAAKDAPLLVRYAAPYLDHGFGAENPGNVYLALDSRTTLAFDSSENAGGFIKPDIGVEALSRVTGLAGDVSKVAAGDFDPGAFLAGALPMLFGLFKLTDILLAGPLNEAPKFITEALDRVAGIIDDVQRLGEALTDAKASADAALAALPPGTPPEVVAKAQELQTAIADFQTQVAPRIAAVQSGFANLLSLSSAATEEEVANQLEDAFDGMASTVDAIADFVRGSTLVPPVTKARLDRLSSELKPVLQDVPKLLIDILRFVTGLNPGSLEFRARLDWKPRLKPWPSAANAIFLPKEDGLVVAVEVRASGKGAVGVDVLAELSDFALELFPGAGMVRVSFRRIAFRGGSNRKPEIDVVFGKLEFIGILSFVETLKELIPLDGFSDPPFLEASSEGVTAGFTVALPNLAIGIFSLTNLSLGADTRIPFLGQSVTVGFSFCTRERPFTLAVAFLGGGGFFGIRISPKRLEVLELSLEFGAVVALNFGVASGSVSAMGGIYMRLEGDAGSLTGYFRVRGEVDVLSLISASIELYMALTYEFSTGKMIGKASITVAVKVFVFSGSVQISCERRFAGSNGDPTVAEMLAVRADGSSEPWDEYCQAFAGA